VVAIVGTMLAILLGLALTGVLLYDALLAEPMASADCYVYGPTAERQMRAQGAEVELDERSGDECFDHGCAVEVQRIDRVLLPDDDQLEVERRECPDLVLTDEERDRPVGA
jgi:hypothetical protein